MDQRTAAEPTHLSPWNKIAGARIRKVQICDCTLREGEQAAGAAFGSKTRSVLARRIADLGIPQIQVGYPGTSTEDREMAEMLSGLGLPARLEGIAMVHVDGWRQHVIDTVRSGVDIVSMQFGISDIRLRDVLHMTRQQALDVIERAVKTAQDSGAKTTSFSPTDTSRADPQFTLTVYEKLQSWGVNRVRVLDSMGAASPAGFRALVSAVRRTVDIPVGVHCHNDYGLALANIITAVEVGADFVDVVANGLGERTGNVAMDEVVLVLNHLYGQDPLVPLDQLVPFAKEVEGLVNVPLSPFKPISGDNAFAHQLDNHVRGVLSNPRVYEPYDPTLVGNRRRFPLGRLSGRHTIAMYLREWGVDPESVDVHALELDLRAEAVRVGEEVDPSWLRSRIDSNRKVGPW